MALVGYRDYDQLAAYAERAALKARALLGIVTTIHVDIVAALRELRSKGVVFAVVEVEDAALPDAEAQWHPIRKTITIRKSVLARARAGDPRARFTVAHEIGHAFMRHNFKRNRNVEAGKEFGKILKTQEAEANSFAAAFLSPASLVEASKADSAEEVGRMFGLSRSASELRLRDLRRRRFANVAADTATDSTEAEGKLDDTNEPDSYELYMQAVLRQALVYPDR